MSTFYFVIFFLKESLRVANSLLLVCMCLQCKDFSVKLTPNEEESNKELRRLQFFGAGPKMAGYNQKIKKENDGRGKKTNCDYDPVS